MSDGYELPSKKQHSGTDNVTLFSSATIEATTNGDAVDVRHGCVALTLAVTAIGGSPTLDVAVQTRKDADDSWRAVGSFAQKTGISAERKCFAGCDRQVRAVLTVGGSTPSLTCSVSGDSL